MSELERAQGDCGQCEIASAFAEGKLRSADISACKICQAEGRQQQRKQALIIQGIEEEATRREGQGQTTTTLFARLIVDL